jgi:hypothetical protein
MTHRWILYLLSSLLALPALAQISVQPNQRQLYTGQPLRLRISLPGADSITSIDTSRWWLQQRLAALPDGNQTLQTLVLATPDSGRLALPDLRSANGLSWQAGAADSITVLLMPADSLRSYSDIKTNFASPDRGLPWMRYLLPVLAVVSGALLWWLLRRRQGRSISIRQPLAAPAEWQQEMNRLLRTWQKGKLPQPAAAEAAMVLVRSLLLLQRQAQPHQTAAEMLAASTLPTAAQDLLEQVVQQGYQIQFGKQVLAADAFTQLLQQLQQAATILFDSKKPGPTV